MKKSSIIVWITTFLLSILFIYFGNQYVTKETNMFQNSETINAKAKVLTIVSQAYEQDEWDEETSAPTTIITFTCKLTSGKDKGTVIEAKQTIDNMYHSTEREVSVGDKVLLYNYPMADGNVNWVFGGFIRMNSIIWLAVIFFLLVLIIGGIKGLNTLVSLAFTCMVVFLVFIPSVLNGFNIYTSAVIVCIFTIIMTLLLINGASKKTLATILGCTFGVIVAAVLAIIMDKALKLTGLVDDHSIYLQMMNTQHPINLRAIIFAAIIIGAMGAVMDVAMDISSSLFEICQHARGITFSKLVASGMSIGRDIMGTMANTLVLAYIGSSLSCVLLLLTYSVSLTELLNREQIIVEFLQALVGSVAILLTIPLTAVICGILFVKHEFYHGEHDEANIASQE